MIDDRYDEEKDNIMQEKNEKNEKNFGKIFWDYAKVIILALLINPGPPSRSHWCGHPSDRSSRWNRRSRRCRPCPS